MHPLRFPLLADENIPPEVIGFLRQQGVATDSVSEPGIQGSADRVIVALAVAEQRVILTHDSDFGEFFIQTRAYKQA